MARIVIDTEKLIVTVDGEEVALSVMQWRLLAALYQNQGRWLSQGEIVNAAWDGASSGSNLKTHISQLRSKMPSLIIESWRGYGYRIPEGHIKEVERVGQN